MQPALHTLTLESDTENKAWDSERAFQIFDRELPVELCAAPFSWLPAISTKFSQRITAVHDMASTLLFLNPPVVPLKIYLCLWDSLMLLSKGRAVVSPACLGHSLLGRHFK